MEIGLLWFDNDPRKGLEEKIRQAAGRYAEKFGQPANLCFLNPATLLAGAPAANGSWEVVFEGRAIKVRTAPQVLPHHFWIGVASNP